MQNAQGQPWQHGRHGGLFLVDAVLPQDLVVRRPALLRVQHDFQVEASPPIVRERRLRLIEGGVTPSPRMIFRSASSCLFPKLKADWWPYNRRLGMLSASHVWKRSKMMSTHFQCARQKDRDFPTLAVLAPQNRSPQKLAMVAK